MSVEQSLAQRAITGTLLVTGRMGTDERLAAMQQIVGDAKIIHCPDKAALAAAIEEAEIVGGVVPRDLFARARSLKWMHSWAAGVDRALYPELNDSNVILTCASGNAAHPIAEQGILLILMLQQDVVRALQQQREHNWKQFTHPELFGKTVGVIGLGDIGLEVVRRAKAFHTRVLGMRRSNTPCPDVDELFPRERLHEMLAECDFVVMAAPMTADSAKMIGEAEFRAMKPSAYFINISRGGCVDEAALIRCMREGWIAGAGIDQPTQKPLPADSELWDLPNTLLFPAYGGHTLETDERSFDIFQENLQRYIAGKPLLNVVDPKLGY
ncbi:MAG: D-2-hydroxyacid dehydrogenase [Litorilinea sp.]